MEKYRKVPREKTLIKEDEIRVTSGGRLPNYITYAAKIFHDQKKSAVVVKATGNAIARAVTLAEILKRRITGLHQLTKCGSTTLKDEYEPLEEGLDRVFHERTVSFIEITLTKIEDDLNKNDPGYQPPLDEALVKSVSGEEMARARGGRQRQAGFRGAYRASYRGYGRGRFPVGPPRGGRRPRSRGGRDQPRGEFVPYGHEENFPFEDVYARPNGGRGRGPRGGSWGRGTYRGGRGRGGGGRGGGVRGPNGGYEVLAE